MAEALLSQKFEYNLGGLPVYIGEAIPGSGGGTDPVWRIQLLTYVGTTVVDIAWAGGTPNFDKKWTLRAGYTYS